MYTVQMPMFGATMESGEINEWYVQVGDTVKKGDALCEISSNKITNTLECFTNGVMEEILIEEGDSAKVGEPIAMINDEK